MPAARSGALNTSRFRWSIWMLQLSFSSCDGTARAIRPDEFRQQERAAIGIRLGRLELADDRLGQGMRAMVVDQDGVVALGGLRLAACQGEERPRPDPVDDVEAVMQALQGLRLDLGDRRARQDVVELAEEQRLERVGQFGLRVGQQILRGALRRRDVRP